MSNIELYSIGISQGKSALSAWFLLALTKINVF